MSAPRFLRPRRGRKLTAQGHARSIFRRAIERRNLLVAEATARELGKVTLDEALDLVCLVCERDATRFDAFAVRWVARVTAERRLTLAELDLAVAALRALPSDRAEATLRRFAA